MATRNKTRTRDPRLGRYDERRPAPDEAPVRMPVETPLHRASWREEVTGLSSLNVIVGMWLIISPFVLPYGPLGSMWNPIVFGAVVGVLAAARAAGAYRAAVLSWVNMAIGVWLFISAFWLASTPRAEWSVGISGIVVFIVGAWSASATEAALARRQTRRPQA
jgi:hypothetical protein